ncbi:MAG: DUF3566 domain-containing protein [Bifidobacteriaceae bacterium]|jgi:hypothetical protein|nr:DUF3566 domain-containing protein [Bifidobacteriaceae bacterium]
MSSEVDSTPDSKPPAGSGSDSGGVESGAVAVERKPVQAKSAPRSGHAVEPPQSIRPKARPKSTVGSAAPVKRVGHGEGESGPNHPKAGASTTGAKRSYRTTRSVPVVVGEQIARKPASAPAGTTGPARTSAKAAFSGGTTRMGGAGSGATASAPSVSQTAVPGVDPGTFTQVVAAAAGIEAAGTATTTGDKAKGSKRVKLNLSYVAPLSVMKISFLVSVAIGIAFVVAVFILWSVLNDRHVFTQIDEMITEVVGKNRPEALDILPYVEQGRVMSGAAIIAVIDVIVFTIISTLVAVIYNIIAALVGGVRVTLKEH